MKPHLYYNGMPHVAGTPIPGGLMVTLLIILAIAATLGWTLKSLAPRTR